MPIFQEEIKLKRWSELPYFYLSNNGKVGTGGGFSHASVKFSTGQPGRHDPQATISSLFAPPSSEK